MGKTSISVPEMGRLLGMKKVEAYWLVKQGRFTVIQVGGKMRIMLDSFEEWYGRQTRYKKVSGPEPGQLLPASLTVPEAANILGLNPGSVYELIKNHAPFETFKVDGQTRIKLTLACLFLLTPPLCLTFWTNMCPSMVSAHGHPLPLTGIRL